MPASTEVLGTANFHCSPAASIEADGSFKMGAVTATASFRFAKWLDDWFKLSGCNVIIGKGGMTSDIYRRSFVPNKAIYLTTVGYGTGALLGRGIKKVSSVHWVEELGLAQANIPFDRLRDPEAIANWPSNQGRDGARTPMPWSGDKPFGGFSKVEPWLPMPAEHAKRAVAVQEKDKASVLACGRGSFPTERGCFTICLRVCGSTWSARPWVRPRGGSSRTR